VKARRDVAVRLTDASRARSARSAKMTLVTSRRAAGGRH
jgi:hypothetical protein